MAGRIANGWELTKQSWSVLMGDKKLLFFPAISSVACLLVLASFALPIVASLDWNKLAHSNGQQAQQELANPLYYAILFAFYFVNYFVVVFFNSALVACVHEHFKGGSPTIGFGFSAAAARLPQIVLWALLSATVGVILQMIAERSKIVGAIVARLLGAGWAIATYFAVPVLVVEKANPFQVFKRSLSLLTKSWGEGLAANIGMGLAFFLAALVAALPAVFGAVVAATQNNVIIAIVGFAISLVLWIAIGLISSTMKVIVTTALYQYAATGSSPSAFDAQILQTAFRQKKKKN